MAEFVLGFLPALSIFSVGVALLLATVMPGNDERAKRERVWALEVSPRGLCRLLGWVLTIAPVWRTVGYLADRQPVEFLVAAVLLLLMAKGVAMLKVSVVNRRDA